MASHQGTTPGGTVSPAHQAQPASTPAVPPQGQPGQPVPQATPPVVQQPAPGNGQAAPAQTPQPPTSVDPDVQLVPMSAFKRIKGEAAEKGGQEALSNLAKEHGFDSVEAMQEALKGGGKPQRKPRATPRKPKPAEPTPAATPPGEGDTPEGAGLATAEEIRLMQRDMRLMQKRQEKMSRENAELSKRLEEARSLTARMQGERDSIEAEMHIREVAAQKGIVDLDYAIRLMTREQAGKTEEELKEFNIPEFFDSLRTSRPYLFGERTVPVTTGNGAGAGTNGSPPNPAAAAGATAEGGKVDARKLSNQEYQELLKSRGLNPAF